MSFDRAKATVQPFVTGKAPGYLPGSRSLDGLAPDEHHRVWPGVAVGAEGAGDLIGLWRVSLVPEANDHDESLFPVRAPERGYAAGLDLPGTLFDGSLKVLWIVVLAPEDDDVLQPAADVELPFREESEISRAKVCVRAVGIVGDRVVKHVLRKLGLVPVPLTRALTGDPNLPDS